MEAMKFREIPTCAGRGITLVLIKKTFYTVWVDIASHVRRRRFFINNSWRR
jgi:hypothetical protein